MPERGGDNGGKGEGTIIKDTWTITSGGSRNGREVGRARVVEKGRKLY